MPRHLICDVHEWINEIPTVFIYYLANLQPRERAWGDHRGKKTLLSLTLVWFVQWRWGCSIGGRLRSEMKYHYLWCHCTYQDKNYHATLFEVVRVSRLNL